MSSWLCQIIWGPLQRSKMWTVNTPTWESMPMIAGKQMLMQKNFKLSCNPTMQLIMQLDTHRHISLHEITTYPSSSSDCVHKPMIIVVNMSGTSSYSSQATLPKALYPCHWDVFLWPSSVFLWIAVRRNHTKTPCWNGASRCTEIKHHLCPKNTEMEPSNSVWSLGELLASVKWN